MAFTGMVATMPYIALQLVGIQVVIAALGIESLGLGIHLPLIIAFIILAAFTYTSGLLAPAAIAIVKDILIWVTVIVAVIVIPIELGGYGEIFAAVPPAKLLLASPQGNTLGNYSAYATLAFGSALALFLHPHSVTGVLSASNRRAISRNAAFLAAYSFLLALIVLLGFMAIAAGVDKVAEYAPLFKQHGPNFAVPALIPAMFPPRFAGVAFVAIAIGALVPAAIMLIAASNLWTRNIYREFTRPDCTGLQESQMAKIVSLIIKFGALVFILGLPLQYAIELQLLGGVWIIQTLPAVIGGLYTRWFHDRALVLGWVAGTAIAASQNFRPIYPRQIAGWTIPTYAALASLILNVVVVIALTPIFNAIRAGRGADETRAEHYV